jgi:hypothetical protein
VRRKRTRFPSGKLEELEARYDAQFSVVFDAIRKLMTPPSATKESLVVTRTEAFGAAFSWVSAYSTGCCRVRLRATTAAG